MIKNVFIVLVLPVVALLQPGTQNISGINNLVRLTGVSERGQYIGNTKQDETIPWKAGQKLTWADYKGKPDPATDAAASTSSYLGIGYHINNGKFSYNITCEFSKLKSWGRYKTDAVLAHEQGHFDIAEIYARELNKEMGAYVFNKQSYARDLEEIYKRITAAKDNWQDQYDQETDHSIKTDQQKAWLSAIARRLDGLKEYGDYRGR